MKHIDCMKHWSLVSKIVSTSAVLLLSISACNLGFFLQCRFLTFVIYSKGLTVFLGSIPIVVRPQTEDRNYLQIPEWLDYPGPVLESWDEFPNYMERLAVSSNYLQEIDNLQRDIHGWYLDFKYNKSKTVRHRLSKLLRCGS